MAILQISKPEAIQGLLNEPVMLVRKHSVFSSPCSLCLSSLSLASMVTALSLFTRTVMADCILVGMFTTHSSPSAKILLATNNYGIGQSAMETALSLNTLCDWAAPCDVGVVPALAGLSVHIRESKDKLSATHYLC